MEGTHEMEEGDEVMYEIEIEEGENKKLTLNLKCLMMKWMMTKCLMKWKQKMS